MEKIVNVIVAYLWIPAHPLLFITVDLEMTENVAYTPIHTQEKHKQ